MVSKHYLARGLQALALVTLLAPWSAADEKEAAKPAEADDTVECSELGFAGKAGFNDIGSLGQFDFNFELKVSNATENPITIKSANLLLGHEGGWLIPLDPESFDGSYLRDEITVEAGTEPEILGSQEYKAETPAIYTVLIGKAEDGHCAEAYPIVREAFEPPQPFAPPYPLGIGIIEPLHVVPFADGEDSVLFIGQHQVLNGEQPTDVETELTVVSDRGGSQPVKWKGFDAEGDLVALWPFARRLPVDKKFEKGMVGIKTRFKLNGKEKEIVKSWAVKRIQPAMLRAPVEGTWQLSSGPGAPRFNDHYARPQFRYAYDLVKLDNKGRTHKGNPQQNDSYYAWERDVLAAADGEIVAYCDHAKDNPGYSRNPQCALNYMVIKHANELYTAYLHLKHKSRVQGLFKGKQVRAGAVVARVGNSGESSEPHLHFMAFRIDQTGRVQSVPVTFGNAFHDTLGKRAVKGVPLGGRVYYFRGR